MAIERKKEDEQKANDAIKSDKNSKLEPCDKPHVAEATRNTDADEACDDAVN